MTTQNPAWMKEYVNCVVKIVELLDGGETVASLQARVAESDATEADKQAFLGALGLAALIVEGDKQCQASALPVVARPAYRKGNGRRPIPWNKCLWQPQREGSQS